MKRLYKKSLYKIFVSLFVLFYTFVPQSIALGQVVEEYSQENAAPIVEEVIPEESLPEEEVVLPEEELPPVVEGPLVEELPTEEPILEPEEVIKEVLSIPVWVINGDSATTSDVIELGKTYISPQNSRVRIIFTKLPENPSKLTITEITLTQEEIDATGAISDKAYDITTDMIDGTFEYDLTLPSTEEDIKVVYVEERGDIFTDIKEVSNTVVNEGDTIKIEDLEHFTIYIVTSTVKLTSEVNGSSQVTVTPGQTITVTMEVELSGSEPNDWLSSRYQIEGEDRTCVNTPDHTSSGTYTESFDITAPTSLGTYDLTLRAYDSSGCPQGGERAEVTMYNAIVVVATPPATNPSLPPEACGLDIALVLDVSGSISNSELTQMKNAFKAFVDALAGTPTQFSVTEFDTTANVLLPFTSVTTGSTAIKNAIDSAGGGGYTNWEDGLNKAWSTFSPDPRPDKPNLMIFSSDGNPNRKGTSGTSVSEAEAVAAAVVVSNTIKTAGTRILALGIGSDLDTANMIAISGSNVDTGNILTSDVITSDFANLADDLGELARKTCGGTISVNKYIDDTSTPGGSGWEYEVSCCGDTTKTLTTSSDGTANTGKIPAGTYSIVETNMLSGYSYGSAICRYQNGTEIGSSISNGWDGIVIDDDDVVFCDFINTTNKGSITIVKDSQPDDAQDFAFTTTGTGISNFSLDDDTDATLSNTKVFNNLMPGTFTITEDEISGWDLDSIVCSTGGVVDLGNKKATITLTPGLDVTCTFTNNIKTGTLKVIKSVLNDEDGSAVAGDFKLYVKDGGVDVTGSPFNGSVVGTVFTLEPGTYIVSEDSNSDYTTSFTDDCAPDGSVTVIAGTEQVCTVVNDDIDYLPDISVTKTATGAPVNIPETGGDVEFTFTVTNNGSESVEITGLSDDKFGTLVGDADCYDGATLGGGLSCSFTKTFIIPAGDAGGTHVNVFIATAKDNDGNNDTDTDEETIMYTPVPSIKLDKVVINGYGTDYDKSNWTLYATGDEKGFNYTGDTGSFMYVTPGVPYTLTENGPDGFSANDWSCTGGSLVGNVLTLTAEDDVVCTITNTALPATVVVYKNVIDWNDNDIYSNQEFEVTLEGELLASQDIRDSETEPITATFGNLNAGIYTPTETNIPGYMFNGCLSIRPVLDDSSELRASISSNYVGNGETLAFICENQVIQPILEITKLNDRGISGIYVGDEVTYTIKVTAPDDDIPGTYVIKDVKVIDILPKGFEYILGSWTGVSTEPIYNGVPAEWYIGDMQEGDEITLTYKAKVSGTQDPGLYKDIVYTYGTSILPEAEGDVLGVGTYSGNPSTTLVKGSFVGTEVLVIEDPVLEEGEVLGASIELPRTGAETYLTLGAILSMILGFILLVFNPKRKIKNLLITGVLLLGVFTLVKPTEIFALTPLVEVQIEQPASPTKEDTFKIGFVALDLENRDMKVQCYINSIAFGPEYSTNSGDCEVTTSQITSSGVYNFYVVATPEGGVPVTSDTVQVEVKLEKPSPVTNYVKTEGVCTYTLTFKTANDGRTSKVEIFRSSEQPFTANASTLIKTLTVAPNTDVSYTDTSITDCSKEYYYAIRALDDLNNYSGFVTDNIIKIVQGTTTTTVTVNGETGEVAGEETTAGEETEGENGTGAEEENGEVKGDEDDENGEDNGEENDDESVSSFWNKYKYVIIAAGVVVLGSAGYSYVRRKK